MITDWLRRVFRGLLETVAGFLGRLGLGANAVTIIGCLLSIGVAVVLARGEFRLGGVLLLLASAFDGLDGTLARQQGVPTKFGAFLDSVLDRVSESAVLLGLAYWYMSQQNTTVALLAYLAVVGSMLVSYARARAEGLSIPCKGGFFTRVERCVVLIVALFFSWTVPALWILAIGTNLTALQRILHVYGQTKGQAL